MKLFPAPEIDPERVRTHLRTREEFEVIDNFEITMLTGQDGETVCYLNLLDPPELQVASTFVAPIAQSSVLQAARDSIDPRNGEFLSVSEGEKDVSLFWERTLDYSGGVRQDVLERELAEVVEAVSSIRREMLIAVPEVRTV